MKKDYVLVLDIGTSGIKSLVFDKNNEVIARAHQKIKKFMPEKNWVEQDPDKLIKASINTLKAAVAKANISLGKILGLAITNQRETTILWNKHTGKPFYRAIVWEDKRTKKYCQKLKQEYGDKFVKNKTGLVFDSYFSASKINWILKKSPAARQAAQENNLLFGTVDTWILWNLLEGNPHLTDYTNASRTLLFNIKNLSWDKDLANIFNVPLGILPTTKPSTFHFGNLQKNILGEKLPILAVCGDQQSSLYAVGHNRGLTKITYGTGTFLMQVVGEKFRSQKNFFTTIFPGCAKEKNALYAIEAKIEGSGSRVDNFLRKKMDLLPLLKKIAREVDVYVKKLPLKPSKLIIDGGITRDERMGKIQQKISGIAVVEQKVFDGTSLGASLIARNFNK